MKTIVTHMNPDLDAITSVWLLKRFGGPDWEEAEVKFIPAGQTYKGKKVDSDPDILHVDVGLGKLDHHQTSDTSLCAAILVFKYLVKRFPTLKKDKALLRLIKVVRQIDWAGYLKYDKAESDVWSFLFFEHGFLGGWQKKFRNKSDEHFKWGAIVLDGIYENLIAKVEAEKVLKEKAVCFKTRWGKGIGAVTDSFGFVPFVQAQGYPIVVAKNPKTGHLRIHAFEFGRIKIDLAGVWELLKAKDPDATWFLHASKKMILNGSKTNPDMIPTKLGLQEVIAILKKEI
jgi:hypothetical protein